MDVWISIGELKVPMSKNNFTFEMPFALSKATVQFAQHALFSDIQLDGNF